MNRLEKSAFKLIGLRLPKKTTNKTGQSSIDCGNLWQEFERGKLTEHIPNKSESKIYAVYFDYEGDHAKPFSYFIGCKVESETATPKGLNSLTIPEQKYYKITAKGKMPDCISESWKGIWNSEIDRSYGYDFEVYDERSNDWNDAEVDIFVASN
jgi:predicted transcriptional regulator YdeE